MTPTANGDFVVTFVVPRTFENDPAWPGNLIVYDVFAVFDDPNDECVTVSSDVATPMVLVSSDPAGFFNSPFLTDPNLPPSMTELVVIPARRWDTFVTIGVPSWSGPSSPVNTTPGFPLIAGTFVLIDNGGWQSSPIDNGIGRAGDYPGNQVLIARLTVRTGRPRETRSISGRTKKSAPMLAGSSWTQTTSASP